MLAILIFILCVITLVIAVRLWDVETKMIHIRNELKESNEKLSVLIEQLDRIHSTKGSGQSE
ncbi:hypothetical protein DUZ99_19620 [Xylanibacillus composti]|uniref:Uncharacterized protein n=1 Tax=Xylanibacillus composti TaxID=1572762 RepID=A0A8J4M2Z9_9BACL|nr:hypothetical protein [Xylanibacillus composti]GIQ70410.1 hypothetical protein XYCOK13_32340 [Xylanibacillus composti]